MPEENLEQQGPQEAQAGQGEESYESFRIGEGDDARVVTADDIYAADERTAEIDRLRRENAELTKRHSKLVSSVGIQQSQIGLPPPAAEPEDELEVDYDDPKKTPSKRLRGVLYRNFEQDNKGYKNFEDYYRSQMETIIVHFKGKLE